MNPRDRLRELLDSAESLASIRARVNRMPSGSRGLLSAISDLRAAESRHRERATELAEPLARFALEVERVMADPDATAAQITMRLNKVRGALEKEMSQ